MYNDIKLVPSRMRICPGCNTKLSMPKMPTLIFREEKKQEPKVMVLRKVKPVDLDGALF